jgi:hypothetical protein
LKGIKHSKYNTAIILRAHKLRKLYQEKNNFILPLYPREILDIQSIHTQNNAMEDI